MIITNGDMDGIPKYVLQSGANVRPDVLIISKWFLVLGTLEADQVVMLVVLLGSSLLNAAYFLPIVYRAFFCTREESMFEEKVVEAPLWCVVPLTVTAVCSVALFFFPQPFFSLASLAVRSITGG